jgi:hypothetical protein
MMDSSRKSRSSIPEEEEPVIGCISNHPKQEISD